MRRTKDDRRAAPAPSPASLLPRPPPPAFAQGRSVSWTPLHRLPRPPTSSHPVTSLGARSMTTGSRSTEGFRLPFATNSLDTLPQISGLNVTGTRSRSTYTPRPWYGECAEKFSCPPSPNLKQIENISTTGSRTPSPDMTEALKEVVLKGLAKDPTAWLDMTRVSAKISKLFLEAQDWAEKFRVPTNTSISLFLLFSGRRFIGRHRSSTYGIAL